jgi:hypothetical protein
MAQSTSLAPADVPDPPQRRAREAALIVLLGLTLNLAGNAATSLWDRDEPRYAVCAREMRARGDWIHPTFNGEPFYHKPILIYWLLRAGTAIGGDNPFGARLISALAGTGTCLVVWAWGRRMLGARVGLWAALVLATAPIMVVESKLATTDACLALWVVLCQAALWELSRGPSRALAGVFWISLALATLTKGPVGPVLIVAAALVSWWWGGPTGYLKRLQWLPGLILFLLVAAPWYLIIQRDSQGEFFRVMIGDQVFQRMAIRMEDHPGFPGFYLATGLLAFFPWSALVPAASLAAWSRRRSEPAAGFLLGWLAGSLLVFEGSKTKLVHYTLPAAPACALLVAWLIVALSHGLRQGTAPSGVGPTEVGPTTDPARGRNRTEAESRDPIAWPSRLIRGLTLSLLRWVGLGWVIAAGAGVWLLPGSLRWPCLTSALIMALGLGCAQRRLAQGRAEAAAAWLVAAWSALGLTVGGWLLPATEPYRISVVAGQKLKEASQHHGAQPVLATFRPPGLVYLLGRPVPVVRDQHGFWREADRAGLVVAALLPRELEVLQRDPRLKVEPRQTVRGFDVERFQSPTVTISLVQAVRPPVAHRENP